MSTRHVVRLVAALSVCCAAVACTACAPDPDAIHSAPADTSPHVPPGVTRLEGSPEQLGTQHGTLLADEIKIMLGEYVGDVVGPDGLDAKMLARVRTMKPSLPEWYRRELAACAAAAGVDEGVLLYAQCEGDIRSLWGCTSYVAFGNATADGAVEMARNFDYWGLDSTQECARVFAYIPQPEDGYAFVSVGWTGILGGWTFVNEKGLFVANTLNWRLRRDPRGVPTLILERIIAQKAATVDEAIALVEAGFFGLCSALSVYPALANDRGLVIDWLVRLSPEGARLFYWVLAALAFLFVVAAALLAYMQITTALRIAVDETGILLPTGQWTSHRESHVAFSDIEALKRLEWKGQVFLYIYANGLRYTVAKDMLPRRGDFEEILSILEMHAHAARES